MSTHSPVDFDEIPPRVREAFEALGPQVGWVFEECLQRGQSDVVIKVHLEEEGARIVAVDRQAFQRECLHDYPLDSSERGSFFEHLNQSVTDGFWVTVRMQGVTDQYLFQMGPVRN